MISLSKKTFLLFDSTNADGFSHNKLYFKVDGVSQLRSCIKNWYRINFKNISEEHLEKIISMHINHYSNRLYAKLYEGNISVSEFRYLHGYLSKSSEIIGSDLRFEKETMMEMHLEFLVASHLTCKLTGNQLNTSVSQLLLEKVRESVVEFSLDLFCEMKDDLSSRIVQSNQHLNQSYNFLHDPLFNRNQKKYILSNYNLKELRDIFYQEVPRMYKRFSLKLFLERHFFNSEISIDDYLESEMNCPISFAYFTLSSCTAFSNPALLRHIFYLYNQKQIEDLSTLSIF